MDKREGEARVWPWNVMVVLVLSVLAFPAESATLRWDTTEGDSAVTGGSGDWFDGDPAGGGTSPQNWTSDGGTTNQYWSNGTPDSATFDVGSGTVTLTADITAQSITIDDGVDYTLTGTNMLSVGGGGIDSGFGVDAQLSVETPVSLTANQGWRIPQNDLVEITGDVSGNVTWSKNGVGTLRLSGDNSGFTGRLNITQGELEIGSNTATGTGVLDMDGSNPAFGAVNGNRTVATTLDVFIGNPGSTGTVFFGSHDLTFTDGFDIRGGNTGDPGIWNMTVNGSGIISFTGDIGDTQNPKGMQKLGPGALALGGNNSLSSTIDVDAGTLLVNGQTATLSTVSVNGGTIAGGGTVVADGGLSVGSDGTLSPGESVGVLTVDGDLHFDAGSTFATEIQGVGTAGIDYDQLVLADGDAVLGGTLEPVFDPFAAVIGDAVFLIDNQAATTTGTFGVADDQVIGTFNGLDWAITYDADVAGSLLDGGNDVALYAVPEPAAALLLLVGSALLWGRRNRA